MERDVNNPQFYNKYPEFVKYKGATYILEVSTYTYMDGITFRNVSHEVSKEIRDNGTPITFKEYCTV